MSARLHGVVSITLVGIAILVAVVTGFQSRPVLGSIYVAGCAVAPLGIVYAFCAKCPCATRCTHVIFGKLAVALTNRTAGLYTPVEVAIVGVALLWLLGLPQVWLWRTPVWFGAFLGLNAVAVAQIRLAVCPACDNARCPIRGGGWAGRSWAGVCL